jgi:hypothetical protein
MTSAVSMNQDGKTRLNAARRTSAPGREQQAPAVVPMQTEALSSEREALLRGVLAALALATVDQELRRRLDARRAPTSIGSASS